MVDAIDGRDSQAMPAVCTAWLERWLGPEDTSWIAERGAPWSSVRTVQWVFLIVDTTARDLAAMVFDAAGAPDRAALHRALLPIQEPVSSAPAMGQLSESGAAARELGAWPLFFASTRRAVEEAARLYEGFECAGALDGDALESLFGESGAADMALGRAIGSGVARADIVALYRAKLGGRP